MELQIKDLVESIKKEGVDTARAEAETIIADAKKAAAEIISKAEAQARLTKETSEREIALLKENALVSAQQAKRDAVLSFKALLAEEIKKGLEIRPVKGVKAGFRLADKDGSGYFDCSDEVITQMLMPYFKDLSL